MAQESKKPEWFEIAESDNAAAAVTKVDKKLTLLTAFAAVAIIGAGVFFANASEPTSANAKNLSPASVVTPTTASAPVSAKPSPTSATTSELMGVADPSLNGMAKSTELGEEGHDFGEGKHHEGIGHNHAHEHDHENEDEHDFEDEVKAN